MDMGPSALPDCNLENSDHPYHYIYRKWYRLSEDPEEQSTEDISENKEEKKENKEEALKSEENK